MNKVSTEELKRRITAPEELALIDVREAGAFSRAHLLFAVSVPLSRLELGFAVLVPRLGTPIVLCDDCTGVAERAAERLAQFGYTRLEILDGGIGAWQDAGYEIFSGVNVPSKAFGEFVEQEYETPRLPATQVKAKIDAGEKVVILDSRPMVEFNNMSIPGGSCCPGAELVYRVSDAVEDPDTLVVVNCAGRTRSIIGCQSLINAGIPNPVVALKDGTMGWHLAGFGLDHGQTRFAPPVSESGLKRAQAMAASVSQRFGVRKITPSELSMFQDEAGERSLFLLDVRSAEEYEAGHLSGSISAPGGQLVQATDEFVGVRNARLVLIDDTGVRAVMTASWLIQMGWESVYVLEDGLQHGDLETGKGKRHVLGLDGLNVPMISPLKLHSLLTGDGARVFDLSNSLEYRAGHISGARRAARLGFSAALEGLPVGSQVVVTSADGVLAQLTVAELAPVTGVTVFALEGGLNAWRTAGYALVEGEDSEAGELPEDVWYRPYDRTAGIEQAMQAYLSWEVALVEQIERDGTTRFLRFES
ncbi:MAG: rhodanese-like domain-containing protein [Arenicellales bacterium]|nr:rhodanese-like domain-containing protein [Arenicellales bacterium]